MAEGIIEALRDDHDRIQDLFAQLEDATGDERKDLFQMLVGELVRHEVAEEEILRPVSRREAGKRVVEARLKEENEAEVMLKEMETMDTSTSEFDESLQKVRQTVEQHAKAEETEEFPKVEKAQDKVQLELLGKAYEVARMMAPTHPHPELPNSAAANLLVGPYIAVMDRARDVMQGALRAVS